LNISDQPVTAEPFTFSNELPFRVTICYSLANNERVSAGMSMAEQSGLVQAVVLKLTLKPR